MPENNAPKTSSTRKNQIVYAALKVFCEKGYDGATVNDIVKKAKCSHGLFYHYFNNKKEIFDAVGEIRGKNMSDFLDEVLTEKITYADKLYRLTEYTFDNIKKDEIFAYRYYFFISNVFIKAESEELCPKRENSPRERILNFFEEGIKNGEFKDSYPPSESARLYHAIIQGATLSYILCPKEFKHTFNFPAIKYIVEIFKKENKNG